ncbi:MAG: hypothetical protein SNJ29_13385 [Rikenellaceae bacterium]
MSRKNKTVYFLGAGFSKDAGGPIQNEIIKTLLSNEFNNYWSNEDSVIASLKAFKGFLSSALCIPECEYENIILEDIFTPIDRCIADGKSFGAYSLKDLVDLRAKLHTLLALSIQFGVDKEDSNKKYINDFAKYINDICVEKADGKFYNDKVSIITTNWDILLDNSLNDAIQDTLRSNSEMPLSVVDYCCYMSSLQKDPKIKPGLLALGKGGYNIKYLKLHGSMNWLHCPLCQRLYVKFYEKTMMYADKYYCSHCRENFRLDRSSSISLKGNLMLPTFIKDLSNVQMQLIWQNAGIELSEASKIVFLGYSLPAADFEIKQLLSRFIRKDAKIEVVLFPGDENRIREEKNRYRYFLGDRITNDSFIIKRIPEYVNDLCCNTLNL